MAQSRADRRCVRYELVGIRLLYGTVGFAVREVGR